MSKAKFNIDLLNGVRAIASTQYQERIPQATRENYEQIAQSMKTHQETLNEFTGLVVKIGKQLFATKMAINPLSKFKKGSYNGTDIEEIFVNMAQSEVFNPSGDGVIAPTLPNIDALYYKQNYQATYKTTTSDQQAKNAFNSGIDGGGLSTLLSQIVQSMYSGATHDEFINMKEMMAKYTFKMEIPVAEPVDEATGKAFVKAVRKTALDLTFMSDKFNKHGSVTRTEMNEQVLIIHKDLIAEISVDVLATAFNMSKVEFETSVVVVDDFGSLKDTYAVLCDKDWFMMFDTLQTVETFRNGQGLFTNHFLHVWQTQALSDFKNAVIFKKAIA